jgi:hypothetical protein
VQAKLPSKEIDGVMTEGETARHCAPSPAPGRTCSHSALVILVALLAAPGARAEDGYALWLRYLPVSDASLLEHYRASITELVMVESSPTLRVAREEIRRGLRGLLSAEIPLAPTVTRNGRSVSVQIYGAPERKASLSGR